MTGSGASVGGPGCGAVSSMRLLRQLRQGLGESHWGDLEQRGCLDETDMVMLICSAIAYAHLGRLANASAEAANAMKGVAMTARVETGSTPFRDLKSSIRDASIRAIGLAEAIEPSPGKIRQPLHHSERAARLAAAVMPE